MKEGIESWQQEALQGVEDGRVEGARPNWLERIRAKLRSFKGNEEHKDRIIEDFGLEDLSGLGEETTLIEVASDVAQEEATTVTRVESKPESAKDIYEEFAESLRAKYGVERIGKRAKNSQEILEAENPLEYLAAVRVFSHLPNIRSGKLFMETPMEATDGRIDRATIHFTLNQRVELQNAGGSWEGIPYAIFMPTDKAVEENGLPYGIGNNDTYWLMEQGLTLPEGTTIAYRKGLEDPRLEELIKSTRKLGLKIQFVESEDLDDDKEVGRILSALGYRDSLVPGSYDLKEKLGVRGSSQHNLTPVYNVEKVFLGGHPDTVLSESNWNRKKRTVGYTPADSLRILDENRDHFPEGLRNRYEQEAVKRLNMLMNDPALAEEMFAIHFEKGMSHEDAEEMIKRDGIADPAKKAEMGMYRDLATHFFENGGAYFASFVGRHADSADSIIQRMLAEMGQYSSEDLEEVLVRYWDGIPEDYRVRVLGRFMEVGGVGAVLLLESTKASLSDSERGILVEAVKKSASTIESRFGSRHDFEEAFIGYLDREDGREWYEGRYGKEFVDFFLDREKHGRK